MTTLEHENYAKMLFSSLLDDRQDVDNVIFEIDRESEKNTARAMLTIIVNRLFKKTREQPKHEKGNSFEWKDGIFNCRNISDRKTFFTNIPRKGVENLHEIASKKCVTYVCVCSMESDPSFSVWVIPEPVLYGSLSSISLNEAEAAYPFEISANEQRIKHFPQSPDITTYFQEIHLSKHELQILSDSRQMDQLVKDQNAAEDFEPTSDPVVLEKRVRRLLARKQMLPVNGNPNPERVPVLGKFEYKRLAGVIVAVLQKAQGTCELCTTAGPFMDRDGKIYLEVHHVKHLAESGPDSEDNAVAVCPNCHRKLHYGKDAPQAKEKLYKQIARLIRH
jgi:hypothetical protein